MNKKTTKAILTRCRLAFSSPCINRLDSLTGAAKVFNSAGKAYRVGDKLSDEEVDSLCEGDNNLITVKGK